MNRRVHYMTRAAVTAAAYMVLTLPMAQFAFGPIQFRLAEALTVLAAWTPAAIPGLFLGCLLANLLNPQSLGPVDILGGSLATLIAAAMTWHLRKTLLPAAESGADEVRISRRRQWIKRVIVLSPSVIVNALVVGFYLPWIIPDLEPSAGIIAGTMLSIFLSQALVVYVLGLPLLAAVERIKPVFMEDRR